MLMSSRSNLKKMRGWIVCKSETEVLRSFVSAFESNGDVGDDCPREEASTREEAARATKRG